ncbi:MAG: hypothetical protein DRP78_04600 [Candidatus Omnitrophota bacterium]|nr:MAG: hypothetical protein DRP78_04600 [Candidatus Omnitrophota bacterium]
MIPAWLFIIICLSLGFILIFIETVLIPGFGVAGILGIISIVYACYSAFADLNLLAGIAAALTSILVTLFLFRILPQTNIWDKIRLSACEQKKMGFNTSRDHLNTLIDQTGRTLTMLRPSGTALINQKRYDVITDAEFIAKNIKIIAYKIEGNKIFVKKSAKN